MNGRGNPVIFQIAGYSNSGKTTFISKLIKLLSKEEKKVVTLKHHGHDGDKPEVQIGKDSSRHIEAGAAASIVEGGGRIILQAEQELWTLPEQIELLSLLKPDYILIEGYKQEAFQKAVLLRYPQDWELLEKLTNIAVVFYWDEGIFPESDNGVPSFHINDDQGIQWLKDRLLS